MKMLIGKQVSVNMNQSTGNEDFIFIILCNMW